MAAPDEEIADIVSERKAMREELEVLRRPENLVDAAHRFGKKST